MAKIDEFSPKTGRMIKEDDTVVNIVDILQNIEGGITEISGRDTNSGSLLGTVTILSASATELKVGGTPLAGRHTLLVNNDSSFSIFFGFDNTVTTSTGLFVPSGNVLKINLDPNTTFSLFAIAGVTNTDITIIEIK